MPATAHALAPSSAIPTPQPRDLTIDFVRGCCLLLMMIDHVQDHWLVYFTYRPLGFFCAATVFVFLSGYLAGNVYSRYLASANRFLIFGKIWRRAAVLYLVHLAISATIIVVAQLSPVVASQLGQDIALVAAKPWPALVADALFLPSAPMLDVLPMYVFLLLLAPSLLRFFQSGHGRNVFIVSAAVWGSAQAGYSLPLPPFVGIFDVASWQFLFVIALYLGFRQYTQPVERPVESKHLNLAIFGCIVSLFLLRHAEVFSLQQFAAEIPRWWVDKTRMGPLVLVNFLLWLSFLWLVPAPLQRLARNGRVFIAMGQNSLPVFVWHIFLFYLFVSLFPRLASFSILGQAVVVGFAAVCLVFPVSLAINYFVPVAQREKRSGIHWPSFFLSAN